MTGYIHSLQSLGTVDGPGVRAVVFAAGCPLRCIYCHNPDTWSISDGIPTEAEELDRRIGRLYPYIKDGGVTFSGGEPCMQAEFFTALGELLKKRGLHLALDTSGAILNEATERMISLCDLIILDVKFNTEDEYFRYTGGSLNGVMRFLSKVNEIGKTVWIRQVIVPGINDTRESVKTLRELVGAYPCVERIELLPFRKLCLEKYQNAGLPFPLESTPEMNRDALRELEKELRNP